VTRDWAERGSGVAGRAQVGVGRGEAWVGLKVWAARKGLDWVLVCWALGLGFLSFFFYSLFFSFSKYISNKV